MEKVYLTITFSKIRLDIYSLKHYVITSGVKNVRGKIQRVLLTNSGADPGFFLGGGAHVSCSTSTPINHIVFFFAEY